jgi:uncharacterized phiE125 gp8 family phage protein
MGIATITAPTEDPITREEVKHHSRIEGTQDDLFVEGLIKAAVDKFQKNTCRQLVTGTYDLFLDEFTDPIEIPYSPLIDITDIHYFDSDGVDTLLPATVYEASTYSEPGIVRRKYGQYWPGVRCHPESIRIRFRAGYGTAANVPEAIKAALKILVGHWFENREPGTTGTIYSEIPETLQALIDLYKVPWVL